MVHVGLGYPVDSGSKLVSHAASAATSLIPASNLIFHSQQKILTTDNHFVMTSQVSEMGMTNSFSHILLQNVNVMANVTIHSIPLDIIMYRNKKKVTHCTANQKRHSTRTAINTIGVTCYTSFKVQNRQHKSYGLDYIAKDVDTEA